MKLKRLTQTISLMLALVLTMQMIPPALLGSRGQTARAAGSAADQGYTFPNSAETDNTVDAELPEQIVDKTSVIEQFKSSITADDIRYLELLQTYESYYDLPAGAITFLEKYTGITVENFQAMAQSGKDLATSIKIGTLALDAQCSVSKIMALNLSDSAYREISTQMALYNASISSEITAATDTELRKLILQGHPCEQVLNAYAASKVLGDDTSTLLGSGSGTLADALVNRADEINAEKASIVAVPQANTTASGYEPGQSVYPAGISSPYTYHFSDNEKVSLNSGALILNSTDYVLPGVNGLDLVIGRTYHSQEANVYTPKLDIRETSEYGYMVYYAMDIYVSAPGNGYVLFGSFEDKLGPFKIRSTADAVASEYEGLESAEDGSVLVVYSSMVELAFIDGVSYPCTSKEANTYLTDLYGLGNGWSFGFSSIELGDNNRVVLHCADGSSYVVEEWSSNTAVLEDYSLTDKLLVRNCTEFKVGNISSYYKLTYADGKREYFSADGKLIGIQDRFGNTITLKHSTENGYPRIEIKDTVGREVIIAGESTANGHTMTVTLPDGNELTYDVTNFDEGSALSTYTDAVGNSTDYSYAANAAGFDVLWKKTSAEQNIYLNLTTITHPTNAQTHYTYESACRNLGESGLMTVYRVTERKDTAGNDTYNQLTYIYSENDSSGYPEYNNPGNLPDSFSYYATVTDSEGIKTTTTFKHNHTISSIEVFNGENTIQKTMYGYNDGEKLPIRITVEQNNITRIELAEYDEKGNVIASWSSLAEGEKISAYQTSYDYDDRYNLLREKRYNVDAGTAVVVTNTLTDDGKSISQTTVTVKVGNSPDTVVQQTAYTYDTHGNITSVKQYDAKNSYVQTNYTYTGGKLMSEDCNGVETSYTYDTVGRLLTRTDGNGNTTRYTYDAIGNLTKTTNPDSSTVSCARNYTSNSVTVTDENGNRIKYTYTPLGQEYEVIDAATGYVITRKSYDNKQRLIRVEDYIYGSVTGYIYDAFDRVLSETVWQGDEILAQTRYSYDDAVTSQYNKVTKTVVGDANAPSIVTTQYTDKHGNVVMTGQFSGNTEYLDTYTYDRFGNVLTMKDALGRTEYYSYSTLGRLESKIDRNGVVTNYGYDALGRAIFTTTDQGDTLQYVYTKTGQVLLEQSDDQLTQYSYDELGRVVEVTEYDQNEMEDLGLCLVRLNMNGESSIQQVRRGATITLPKLVRTGFTFNGWYNGDTLVSKGGAFRVTENCTLTAKWTVNRYAIAYDLNGGFLSGVQNLTTQVYNYGTTIRLTSVIPSRTGYTFVGWGLSADATVVYPSGAAVTNLTPQANEVITFYAIWSLDPADVPVPSVPTFPGDGEVSSVATVSTYAARSTTSSCGSAKTYAYDLSGNRTRFVLTKDGAAVHNIVYQYDVLNRLTRVYQNSTLCATYEYDVNGNRTKLSYPVTKTGTTYTYNKANWVTAVTSTANGTTLEHYAYSYYASGNQKSVMDKDGIVTSYTYDGLGRLTKESETGGSTIQYTYDAAGNRTKMVVTGTEAYTTTYTYDTNNRLTQESKKVGSTTTTTAYLYDANGNLRQKSTPNGAEQYEYNSFNQLVQLRQGSEVATYTYNASGIRTSKQVGTTTTHYLLDGGDVVAEFTNGTPTARYLRGINLISRTATSGTAYYLHNAHGDVVALTDTSGAVTKRYDYDAFGNEENPSSSDTNPFRYCGEYFDTETETYYLRARYYDPAIGRFTQQDTYLGDYQDPLSLNYYTYCYNNPVRYYDPSGNIPVDTILDFASLVDSFVGFVSNPTWLGAGCLAWDLASTLLPYVPGSYVLKGAKLIGKADDAIDLARFLSKVDNTADAASCIAKSGKSLLMSYRDWKKIIKKLDIKGLEVHHLIEKRFADKLGLKKNSILSIAIDPDTHAEITQAFRDIIGYSNEVHKEWTTANATLDKIWSTIVDVYRARGMESYLPVLKQFLLENAKHVGGITDWCGI